MKHVLTAALAAMLAQPASAQRIDAPMEIESVVMEWPCSSRNGDLGVILEHPRQGHGDDRR